MRRFVLSIVKPFRSVPHKLMIQAGFMERKRNKGTFYIVPTDELLGYAYRNKIDVSIFFEK